MNAKVQFAMPSGVPLSGRRRKPALFTTLAGSVLKRLEATFTAWLDQIVEANGPPATHPKYVLGSIRAGDVVLIAGRTRMSRFIRFLSGSPWTQVALCVGRLEEYTQNADPALRHLTLRHLIARASHGDPKEPVLIEALLGRGTVLTPLRRYRAHAVKICRPRNLSAQQVGRVMPRDFDGSPYFEYIEFPPNTRAAAPARPVPGLPHTRVKVRRTRGAARPFAHPGPFPGQGLQPSYACLPVAPSTTARGRVKAGRSR